jgi:hypothetical protein
MLHRAETGSGLARSPVGFALAGPPRVFTVSSFAARLSRHALFYGALLLVAVLGCLLVAAPLETTGLALGCVVLGSAVSSALSASGRKVRRVLQGGIVASYVVGAGVLLKAITELWHGL